MGKIYRAAKTGDDAVEIAASSYQLIAIRFPYEARIGRTLVRQASVADGGGTAVGFTVDLLDSHMGLDLDTDIPNATALPNNISMFKIFATKTGTAGNTVAEYTADEGGDGYLFRNADGDHTNNERYVYLLLRPTSALTATTWEYVLVCNTDIGA